MLVLSRRIGERIIINDNIVIEIVRVKGDVVRVGINAPSTVTINREEIHEAIQRDKRNREAE